MLCVATRERVASWILDRCAVEQTTNVPRNVIADLLGMRPETLSRALRRLDQEGLIEVSRRSLLFIDPEGLRRKLPKRPPLAVFGRHIRAVSFVAARPV